MSYLGVGSNPVTSIIGAAIGLRPSDEWWTDESGLTNRDETDNGGTTALPTVVAKPLVLNVPAKQQAATPDPASPSGGSMVVTLLLGLGALLIFTGTLKL